MPRGSKTGIRGLSRDQDGRFQIDLRWYEPGSGAFRRYREALPAGTPAAAAKTRARQILALALAGGWNPKRRDERRLNAALAEYVKWRRAHGRAAVEKSEATIERLVAFLGDVALDAVTPFAVERYKRERRNAGAAPATVNRELALLRHFYGLAARWGWVAAAQTTAVRDVPALKEPPGRVRYLTADEEGRLMKALESRPRLRRVVVAALLTGARQGELLGLRLEDVDLGAREIVLTKTKANRVRRIPIADALAPVLEEALAASRSGYVFESRKGRAYSPSGLESSWVAARGEAGLEDFRFHDLRHSAATALRRRGVGLDVIQRLLGHSTITMTTRYAHVGEEAVRQAVAGLRVVGGDGRFAQSMPAGAGDADGNQR